MGQKFQKFGSRTVVNGKNEAQLTLQAMSEPPRTAEEARQAPYIMIYYLPEDGIARHSAEEILPLACQCSNMRHGIDAVIQGGNAEYPYRIWKVEFFKLSYIRVYYYNIQGLGAGVFNIRRPAPQEPWLHCVFQIVDAKSIKDCEALICSLRSGRKGTPLMRMFRWNAEESWLALQEYRFTQDGNIQWNNFRLPLLEGWRQHLSITIEKLPQWEAIVGGKSATATE